MTKRLLTVFFLIAVNMALSVHAKSRPSTRAPISDPDLIWRQKNWAAARGLDHFFILRNGRLYAYKRHSTHAQWAFGHDLTVPVLFTERNKVFVVSRHHSIYTLDPYTGKKVWTASFRHNADTITDVASGRLFFIVAYADTGGPRADGGGTAYDAATGKELWHITDTNFTGPSSFEIAGDVILRGYSEDGAILRALTDGIDGRTGRVLWSKAGRWTEVVGTIVTIRDGQYQPDYDPEYVFDELVVDAKTGQALSFYQSERKTRP